MARTRETGRDTETRHRWMHSRPHSPFLVSRIVPRPLRPAKRWEKGYGDENEDYDNRITVDLILLFICLITVFEHNDNVYKFVLPEDDSRTWYEAETLCKTRENGHLTSLVTNTEIIWADRIIKNIVRDPWSKVKLWIGGSDRRVNDAWDFVDAQPLRYNVAPWAPGQPRRPLQQAPYEFCVYLEFVGDRSRWYVEDCFQVHGYICKSEGRLSTTIFTL